MDDEEFGDGAPSVVGGVRPEGRGPRVARHSSHSVEKHEIQYKAVVQARLERVLVEAFLRRYSRGEAGEYVRVGGGKAGEQYPVGGKFPGVYYRSVRVCSNCYMVYALIGGARARSLQRGRHGGRGKQRSTAPTGSSRLRRIDDHGGGKDKPNTDDLTAGDGEEASPVEKLTAANRRDKPGDITGDAGLACRPFADGYKHSHMALSLAAARRAMDACSQGDISELRSFGRPPPAVLHVTSVAMVLIEGTRSEKTATASWAHARAAMGRPDFLSRLRTFEPRTVRPEQMRAVERALGSPGFRPGIVRPLNNAAANLCLWVLGVVQAKQWMTGFGHPRNNLVPVDDDIVGWGGSRCRRDSSTIGAVWSKESPFPVKALPPGHSGTPRQRRRRSISRPSSGRNRDRAERRAGRGVDSADGGGRSGGSTSPDQTAKDGHHVAAGAADGRHSTRDPLGPATSPMLVESADVGFIASKELAGTRDTNTPVDAAVAEDTRGRRRRRCGGRIAAQALASGRLMNPDQAAVPGVVAEGSHFLCSDGKTRLPYRVCGEPAATGATTASCNFVVVHDFFDNVDKTEVLFRPVTRRHRGCLVLAFSYPGQAGTVFGVPPSMTNPADGGRSEGKGDGQGQTTSSRPSIRGGSRGRTREAVTNNAFVAPRLHELLQHVHSVGEMRLSLPFHLVIVREVVFPVAILYAHRVVLSVGRALIVSVVFNCTIFSLQHCSTSGLRGHRTCPVLTIIFQPESLRASCPVATRARLDASVHQGTPD